MSNDLLREGFKKKYGKFHTGGSARVIFHKQFFFIFFAPNGLKMVKAKIAHIVDKILRVAAIIARVVAKSGI